MKIVRPSIASLMFLAACSRPKPAAEPAPAADPVQALEKAVAANPNDAPSWYKLAGLCRQRGNCEGALVAYRRYTELVPTANEPYYAMGVCQQQLGASDAALTALRRYVANAGNGQDAWIAHARKLIATLEADAGAAAPADQKPLLTKQKLSGELRRLVDEGRTHPSIGSLEAAGCELALVWKRAKYNRFVDLQHGTKMPAQATPPSETVVWCQSRATPPPDCAQLAPIFARVAHPQKSFQVFSGYVDPPFAPRCAGLHDKTGKLSSGEGPGYPSSR